MAATTDQYIVELIVDDTQLESTLDMLERTGQIDAKMAAGFKNTTAEIKKQATALRDSSNASAPLKKNLDDVNKSVKNMTTSFAQGFQEGVIETLNEAGVSMEDFNKAIEGGLAGGKSLRQELKETTLQLAQLKLAGQENSDQYRNLVARAGELKDTLADVNAEIKDAGSDTQGIDNLIGTVQAGVGVFTTFQGVVGLAGAENEDLQKALLKVNSAMAVLQGLQAVTNALQKEGAVTLLAINIQRRIQNASLALETALQSKNVIVTAAATVAQKALNLAMAANPIGIVVVAIAGLITALTAYNRIAGDAERQTGELNAALESSGEGFEKSAENQRKVNEGLLADLRQRGAAQSEILRAQNRLEDELDKDRIARAETLRKTLDANVDADTEKRQEAAAQLQKLEEDAFQARIARTQREFELNAQLRKEALDAAQADADRRVLLAAEGSKAQLQAQRAAIQARLVVELNAEGLLEEQRARLREQARRDDLELTTAYNKRIADAQARAIETQLVNVEAGTQEEFRLRLSLLAAQEKAELSSTKLSEAERNNVIKGFLAERTKLTREYNEAVVAEAIAAQQRLNNAEMELIKTNDEDRLVLQISNIELAASAEVNAAKGNASKIKEINAKRDADILAARKQFLEEATEYEIQLQAAKDGPLKRALQREADGYTNNFRNRLAAIQQLADIENEAIQKRIDLVQEEFDQGLISAKEYNLRLEQLQDQQTANLEDSLAKRKDLQKAHFIEVAQLTIQSAQQVVGLISQIADITAAKEDAEIQRRRDSLEELRTAGAITEREALIRQKKIDAEERIAKRKQAEREKSLALFDAVLNTAQAVTNAISTGDPYTLAIRAAIAGAIGAAQIAIIAARPIPNFGMGKKSGYEGLARVGETGSELIERNGKMYVAKKETIVYLGAKDKVYNPRETKMMLANTPSVDNNSLRNAPVKDMTNYDKLGEVIAGKLKGHKGYQINIDKDGITEWNREKNEMLNYFGNRYKFDK